MFEAPVIDPDLQPDPKTVAFDLNHALSSVVSVQCKIPENAFTAQSLGTERAGHGVVINERGLILTIGYLTVEADTIWLIDHTGGAVAGHVAAYDQETGFGLIQPLGKLNAPVMELGSSSALQIGDDVILAGHGGKTGAIKARLAAKQEFTGYWEYLLGEALMTTPPHPFWGGSALISPTGKLVGIGSLFVQQNDEHGLPFDGNMVVPIDLLPPILDDLLTYGRVNKKPRPWLGLLTAEVSDHLVIASVVGNGPGQKAGLEIGDILHSIDGRPLDDLATFYRNLWSSGDAGVPVTLTIYREDKIFEVAVRSGDRDSFLVKPKMH
ncbi:MAG: serine protease [Rhodospirillales bacterium]|nr:serine protease [Rhodospirillales bacterium]